MHFLCDSRKKLWIIGFLFVSLFGTLGHFFYEWSGRNALVGLFFPVNESTWEHLKLLFFPILLFTLFACAISRGAHFDDCPGLCPALLSATLFGLLAIPTLFYTYSGILGFRIAAVDISTFYISTFLSFLLAGALCKRHFSDASVWLLSLIVLAFFAMFLFFTGDAPPLGIFRPPV